MPATSKAQFRYMAGIEHGGIPARGSLTRSKAAEFVDATPNYKALPERAEAHSGLGKAVRRRKYRGTAVALLGALLAFALACAANRAAFVTAGALFTAVDAGLGLYADHIVRDSPPAAEVEKVRAAHVHYIDVLKAVRATVAIADTAPPPEVLQAAANALIDVVESFIGKGKVPR